MRYIEVALGEAYTLVNPGGLIWVCTRSRDGRHDLAPIAWNCPLDYDPVSRLLFVCDPAHATYENLVAARSFTVALPSPSQADLVEKTGSVSGRDHNKYEEFSIEAFSAKTQDALVPAGVSAWLECRLLRVVEEGTVAVVMGEVVHAEATRDSWMERLHYVAEGLMYRPGPRLR